MFYYFSNAIIRYPGKSVVNGLSQTGQEPDITLLQVQHRNYIELLSNLGLTVRSLEPLESFPDSIFVEDPALTFDGGAVVLRPGVNSRMGEQSFLKPILDSIFENVVELKNGTVEGGDVLRLADKFMVGLSSRTNRAGAQELKEILLELGFKCEIVQTPSGILHLKSDCAVVDEETIIATPKIKDSRIFENYRIITTPTDELAAANLLRINNKVILSHGHKKTADLLSKDYEIEILEISEISKLDAGLSCLSLRW